VCAANPSRVAAFAALPTIDPAAAADELERCVTKHGFKGAMLHGMTDNKFLDLKEFWPIYERAEKLDVPIYFHPGLPHADVMNAYYNDYAQEFPMVVRAAWGYTVETATTAIRMVLSGVFDKHPKLKVVLGHLGETLPFLLWRFDSRAKLYGVKLNKKPSEYIRENIVVTTSGMFSAEPLHCTIAALGHEHVMFSADYPFESPEEAGHFMDTVPLPDNVRADIAYNNAVRLLGLKK
jgi:predicted TIM-barrel fold metal-dependent hydrolase